MERSGAAGSPKNRAITTPSLHIKQITHVEIFTLIYEINDVNEYQYINSNMHTP